MKRRKPPEHHEYLPTPSTCHELDIYFVKTQLEKWSQKFHLQLCKDYTKTFLNEIGEDHNDWQKLNKARNAANSQLREKTERYVLAKNRYFEMKRNARFENQEQKKDHH